MTETPGRERIEVPRAVRLAAEWSWRLLLVLALLGVLVMGLGYFKVLWVPVVIALLLAVLLTPVVEFLQQVLRFPRAVAAGTAVLAVIGFVAGLATLAGRQIGAGFADLWDQAVAGFSRLGEYLADSPLGLDAERIDSYVEQATDQLSQNSDAVLSGALSVTTTAVQVAVGAAIAIFTLVFFLKDGALIWAWLVRLLPASSRQRVHEAGRRGWLTLTSYTKAQILVAAVDAVGIGIGAAILGLPLVVPLALLVFLGAFIPLVGAFVTGAIAVLVALVDQDLRAAVIMLLIVIGVQQLEGNVLQPLLLGHAVSLHPVAVLLVVTGGSLAAGIVGALVAVPVAATINTVVLYLRGRDKFPHLGRDPDGLASWVDYLDSVTGGVRPDHQAKRRPQ